MLKKICGLFLGLVVLAGSACVTPTHASSAQNIIITRIQAGGDAGAKEELVVLYNPSSKIIDITGWCLKNKATIAFACFSSPSDAPLLYSVAPQEYVTVASRTYVDANAQLYASAFYTAIYDVTNQSSGSIVASADTVSLVTATGEDVDAHGWSDARTTPPSWSRFLLFSTPDTYSITGSSSDWARSINTPPPIGIIPVEGEGTNTPSDNTDDGTSAHTDTNTNTSGTTSPSPPSSPDGSPYQWPFISELLPNPGGADAGREFIEITNPNTYDISLKDFSLQIGVSKPKTYILPEDVIMPAQGYYAFYNAGSLAFTLTNTSGKVQLLYQNMPIGSPVEYENAKDDTSWSWSPQDQEWEYTKLITPGAANTFPTDQTSTQAGAPAVSTPKPCVTNQYRNPETGRCKLVSTAASTLVVCKTGYQRNPETGRCRKIATTVVPAACKSGYERNADTGRCRKIKSMTTAGYSVSGVKSVSGNNVQWYYWLGIIGIVAAIVTYGVWEWREEIKDVLRKLNFKRRRRTKTSSTSAR